MNEYYSGEKWEIATKENKGKLPLFCGNIERVIPIYVAMQMFIMG